MRSKEVEEAIKYLKELNPVKYWEMPERVGPDKIVMKKDENLQNVIDKALNYISNLEQENINWKGKYHLLSRKIDVTPNSVIRDKIKELEEVIKITTQKLEWEENTDVRIRYRTTIEQATAQILVLKELLEGE